MEYILYFMGGSILANVLIQAVIRKNIAFDKHEGSDQFDSADEPFEDTNSIKYIAVRGPDTDDPYGRLMNRVPFEDDEW